MTIQGGQQSPSPRTQQILRNAAVFRRKMTDALHEWKQVLQQHTAQDIVSLSYPVRRQTRSFLVMTPQIKDFLLASNFEAISLVPERFPDKARTRNQGRSLGIPKVRLGKIGIALHPHLSDKKQIQADLEHELLHVLQGHHQLFPARKGDDVVQAVVEGQPLTHVSASKLRAAKNLILLELQTYRSALKRGLMPTRDSEQLTAYYQYYRTIKAEEVRRRTFSKEG